MSRVVRRADREATPRGGLARGNARAKDATSLSRRDVPPNHSPATPPTAAGTPPAASQSRAGGRCTGRPRPRAGLGSVGGWWEGEGGKERVSAKNRAEKDGPRELQSRGPFGGAPRPQFGHGRPPSRPRKARKERARELGGGQPAGEAARGGAARLGASFRASRQRRPPHPTPQTAFSAPPPGARALLCRPHPPTAHAHERHNAATVGNDVGRVPPVAAGRRGVARHMVSARVSLSFSPPPADRRPRGWTGRAGALSECAWCGPVASFTQAYRRGRTQKNKQKVTKTRAREKKRKNAPPKTHQHTPARTPSFEKTARQRAQGKNAGKGLLQSGGALCLCACVGAENKKQKDAHKQKDSPPRA